MAKYADSQVPPGSRPNINNLQRALNRQRQKNRPKDPLVFVLMSSRRKKDYKKVLKKIRKILPSIAVREFVIDFEAAIWGAVRSQFPDCTIKGCAFHWSQAIWRHVQSLGLQPQYRQKDAIYKYIRKLMALCFLPAEHIPPVFKKLKDAVNPTESPQIYRLVEYIETTWLHNSVWSVESWSVYMRPTRTNNDVEGWHNRLNKRAINLGLYRIIPLLKEEADLLPLQNKLVSEGKLKKLQRKTTSSVQSSLFSAWEKYREGDITVSRLLRVCGRLVYACDE